MEHWCKREPVPTRLLEASALHIVVAKFMFLKGAQQSPGRVLSGRNKSKWAAEKQKRGAHDRKENSSTSILSTLSVNIMLILDRGL